MSKKENGYKNMAELKLTDELKKNIKEQKIEEKENE